QVPSYLTDHLVWLRASQDEGRNSKGLVPLQVRSAIDCLFISASGKSLVHLEGIDADDIKRYFSWEDSRHNAYSNFDQLLDQQPARATNMMPPLPYGKRAWEDFTQEPNS